MNILTNAFSLNMISKEGKPYFVRVQPITASEIPADIKSAIGHADTATVVGSILGRDVPANRATINLTESDVLYVAQYIGPRLPEGATTLPEGATINFLKVDYIPQGCVDCPARGQNCHGCGTSFFYMGYDNK